MSPQRIQRKRTKGWRMPEGVVYVGRGSKWGNPWVVDPSRATHPATNQYRMSTAEVIDLYRGWVNYAAPVNVKSLAGKDLACWCPLDKPCHADVLLELANGGGAA